LHRNFEEIGDGIVKATRLFQTSLETQPHGILQGLAEVVLKAFQPVAIVVGGQMWLVQGE
jgi:hypothetical protein